MIPDAPESDDLIAGLIPGYASELHAVCQVLVRHEAHFKSMGLSADQSTSTEDCLLLFLLARHFRRRAIFEVGTYVGMTAVALNEAAERNGGHCTTCDPVDRRALPPGRGIRFFHGKAAKALRQLQRSQTAIDFVFFDWPPNGAALNLANSVFTQDTILAVHDYGNDRKGFDVVDALSARYAHITKGRWYLPSGKPVVVADAPGVNICTAFWLPYSLDFKG